MSSRSSHLPVAAGVPDAVELFHVRCHPGQRPDFFRESRSFVEMKPSFGLADCAGWLLQHQRISVRLYFTVVYVSKVARVRK